MPYVKVTDLKNWLIQENPALLMSATLGAAACSKFISMSNRSSPPAPSNAEDIAYGWPADMSDDDALRELLELNGSR